MINRIAEKQLKIWAKKEGRKPLILRGARQVGKTTLVNDFAKNYKVFLSLNLDKPAHHQLFEKHLDVHELIDAIYLFCKQTKNPTSTLLFIDEIQSSPKAVAILRYFYEELPWLHVIAAGSLLETLIDVNISFPVGRVEYLAIHPCSFIEFLDGIGEKFDQEQVLQFNASAIHDRIMSYFKTYMIVGGMPGVIKEYAKNRDLLQADNILSSLLVSYFDDIEKYASNPTFVHIIRFIIKSGWKFGAEVITFENFGNTNYKSREVSEAFRVLEKTMLLELVYPTTSAQMPILGNLRRKPKLIWLDTGLVNYVAGARDDVFNADDITDAWRGKIAEHIVGQELIALDFNPLQKRNFWVREKKQSSAEVDFIIEYNGRIIPIEVKSGHKAKLTSLHLFMDESPDDVAIRIWSKPLLDESITTQNGKTFRFINVPYYYVGNLKDLLSKLGV